MRAAALLGPALLLLLAAGRARCADPPPAGAGDDPARLEFMTAMQRILKFPAGAPDSAALKSYVLYDYLIAARLRRSLTLNAGDAQDSEIDAFLAARGSQPVTRALRHDWLASLAVRKRWDWFMSRSVDSTDPQLACDHLAGRLAQNDPGVAADALVRWLAPARQPDECNPVFDWLRSGGLLTPALAEARTRAALAADNARLARDVIGDVPQPWAAPLTLWIQLLEAPKAALAVLSLDPDRSVEPAALVAGLTKLSYADNAAADSLLPALLARPDLTEELRTRLKRAVAMGAAASRRPGAVAAFAGVSLDPGDVPGQEWRVRAALWAGDFTTALGWIAQMPPTLSDQPRWRYWRARATAAASGADAALPLYADLAGLRDYHGYLAADRIDRPYSLNMHPSLDDAATQAALAAEPGMLRAHALFDCDLTDDALAEWAAALAGAAPALKVQAAHLASRWGWYQETITALAQAGDWDDVVLRYPRPYAAIVDDAAKLAHVAPDWILAIMRQESLFRRDAVSRADARGLMQMQPATAVLVARRWHLPPVSPQGLFNPQVAVPLGALYVRELLDKYHDRIDQALAAYNAGPQAVARWLPPASMDADIWIENIPYAETRAYVQHILEHIVAFAAVQGAAPPRLCTLLPKLEPQAPAP